MVSRLSILFAGFAALLAATACSEAPQASRGPASHSIPVIAEPLGYEFARTRLEAVGTSRALLSAELHSATAGEVVAVNFEPGQFVRAGDVLVELDRREQELEVRLAELRLADAERLHERYARSADKGAVVPATVDAARTAVGTARVELERARLALDERTIEAVFDGHVGATDVDPGDRIGPDTLITTLDDRSALLVSFDIPEAFIGELAAGAAVRLETWSASMPAVSGRIVDVGSRIDPVNRTFVARARVPNDDDALRPGMSFRVRAEVVGERYAVVPETGVQWGANGAYVWSVENGDAVRVPVQVVQRREGRVLVDGAFAADTLVVVEGTQSVRDGSPVSVETRRLADTSERRPTGGAGGDSYSALD